MFQDTMSIKEDSRPWKDFSSSWISRTNITKKKSLYNENQSTDVM